MASKRRRSVAPEAVSASPRPLTKGRCSGVNSAEAIVKEEAVAAATLGTLGFLEAEAFEGQTHVPALCRLAANDPGRATSSVREQGSQAPARGGDPVAEALGFPSPFCAVDLSDRQGVWQNKPPLVRQLGADPKERQRRIFSFASDGSVSEAKGGGQGIADAEGVTKAVAPVGLKNLGATCYLNSLLQYLFFNVDFRQGLLAATSNSGVVRELQRIFALLANGEEAVLDTSGFVSAAGLEQEEQEDATEFSTLLLDWLERELGKSDDAATASAPGGTGAASFIPALFQGETSQLLTCLKHPQLHTFERRENFYELRARLTHAAGATGTTNTGKRASAGKRKSSAQAPLVHLEQLLADTAFPDEMLDGANQYHCPKCDCKVDARKSMRLARAPPYLNVIVERHHYDLQKGERRKLNNSVSFPRRLELPLCSPAAVPSEEPAAAAASSEQPPSPTSATYECIGYLEHVSDSALSGHYTATLYQEDKDAEEAWSRRCIKCAADDEAAPREEDGVSAQSPMKRQRCSNAPCCRDLWWSMDDDRVAPVAKAPASEVGVVGAASADARDPSARIESASAYLLLYRRTDHTPGQQKDLQTIPSMTAELAAFVAQTNEKFAADRQTFEARSVVVKSFLAKRRKAVEGLLQALRSAESEQRELQKKNCSVDETEGGHTAVEAAFSVVPSAWLNAFLRGDDRRLEDIIDGDAELAPVTYGRTLLRAPDGREGEVVDPLAIWCGEVKFLPKAALQALAGRSGLDPSIFLSAERALCDEACQAAMRLGQLYAQEWVQFGQCFLDAKVSPAEARAWQSEGRGDDAVWVASRLQKVYQKITSKTTQPWQVSVWSAFLSEARGARWPDFGTAMEVDSEAQAESAEVAKPSAPTTSPAAAASLGQSEVNLTEGLVCEHCLIYRPKAGILVRRSEIEQLLEISAAKEQAYRELWPESVTVPCLRSGLPDGALLGFGDVCTECRSDGGGRASASTSGTLKRILVVRRRYTSGVTRKQGNVAMPAGSEAITGAALRALVQEQLSLPVARLWVMTGTAEVELRDDENLGVDVEQLLVEKDEAPEPEAAAFKGSIFCGTPSAENLSVSTSASADTCTPTAGCAGEGSETCGRKAPVTGAEADESTTGGSAAVAGEAPLAGESQLVS
mmetsp:Transcript_132341/g.294949  ORF Transcript_132341/g.294949 Transcript_132341/m.294949 type:complete len:1145 (+) Transcript_132341:151-3585(+)